MLFCRAAYAGVPVLKKVLLTLAVKRHAARVGGGGGLTEPSSLFSCRCSRTEAGLAVAVKTAKQAPAALSGRVAVIRPSGTAVCMALGRCAEGRVGFVGGFIVVGRGGEVC